MFAPRVVVKKESTQMKRLITLFFSLPVIALADTACLVVKVSDGDTFSCRLHNQEMIKVRLADIDAPESGQAYGNQAKKALNKLIFRQRLGLKNERKDKYGRTVATVYSGRQPER